MKQNHGMKNFSMWLSICCVTVLVLLYGMYAPDKTTVEDHPADIIRVGTNVGYMPYIYTDQQGNTVGFDIDVINAIAQKMGKKVIIEDMAFDALIVALKQQKVDLIIGGITITPSRLHEIALVPYHGQGTESLAFIFWGKAPAGVTSMADLKNIYPDEEPIIVTQAGTVFEPYLQKWADSITPKTLSFIEEILLDIRYKKAVAAVLETPTAQKLKQMHPDIDIVIFPVSKEEQPQGSGIGICKENMSLITAVEKAVEEMKKSGEIKILVEKWFVKE